ncbi:hypothetical protein SCYAM73S_04738 [Streptomyces cyaneofuscatus]
MLASTVQFSNNDQPPTTPPIQASSLGPDQKDRLNGPYPQIPNNVPDTIHPFLCSTPKQY